MRIIPSLGLGLVLRRLCGSLTQVVPTILADAEVD
jgi:hypothetical protein